MSLRVTGLDELELSLRRAETRIKPELRQVVAKGSLNIKNGMRADLEATFRHGHAKRLPLSITYDVVEFANNRYFIEGQIGPDKDREGLQGALGNFLAFGSVNNAPSWDHAAALEREAPAFERNVADAAERLLS